MADHPAAPLLLLRQGDREKLSRLVRSTSVRAGLAQQARIVLLAADGVSNTEIAEKVGATRTTVIAWQARYDEAGIEGPPRPRPVGAAPADRPPGDCGGHAETAAEKAWGHALVLAAAGVPVGDRPQHGDEGLAGVRGGPMAGGHLQVLHRSFSWWPRSATWSGSTWPLLQNAVVLCVDEMSQVQALERTSPGLPMQPGKPAARTHDYVRHGTSTLFAALEIATGHVTAACKPQHRRQEFLAFLRRVARAYPERELHLVMDNYAVHKTPAGVGVAGADPAVPGPLHAHLGLLAEPGRGVVRDH